MPNENANATEQRGHPRDFERRAYTVEMRAEGDSPKLVGHAAVFNALSEEMYGFREKIDRGAFSKSIAESDVRALWNHDSSFVLGRKKAKTLELAEDERGLAVEINPPNTQWARDVITSIKRGDVDQMSFGFRVIRDRWDIDRSGDKEVLIRTLVEVRLFEVSPVTFPAYSQTDVSARAINHAEELRAELLSAPGRDAAHPEQEANHPSESTPEWAPDSTRRMHLQLRERVIRL